jgi:sulfate permease, SulP family
MRLRIGKRLSSALEYFREGALDPLPIRFAFKEYSPQGLKADFRAAMNVALLDIPQSMAYATIAELPISFGIVCSATASIVSPFFAGSRHTILGPTNATAFLLFSFFAREQGLAMREMEIVPLMVIMVGICCLVGALFRLADLLQYVSRSVLVGYISGAAVLIMANQSKHILGVAREVDLARSRSFVGILDATVRALPAAAWQTIVIGMGALLTYLLLQRKKPRWPALVIVLSLFSGIATALSHWKVAGFEHVAVFKSFTLQELKPSVPHIFREGIFDDISAVLGGAIALAFLACLENTLMVKSISSRTGDRPDVNQDMYALGMANLASAFAGGMTASGSPLRSTLNFNSGAQSRFSSLISGLTVLAAAILLAWLPTQGISLIDHVPKAVLASLIFGIAFKLINLRNIRICLRSTRDDAFVLIATFLSTLLAPLDVAIFIGVSISIALFLRKASRPHLVEYEFSDAGELRQLQEKRVRPMTAISIVHVEGDLFFGAAELFRNQIMLTAADPSLKILILRLKNARHLDATSVLALEELVRFMRDHDRHVLISGATRDVYRVLKNSDVLSEIQKGADREVGESNIFLTSPSNPNLSTRHALRRAQQLLGEEKADVRIFYDPAKA